MPAAKKTVPPSPRRRAAFGEPAALTRLNNALDAAQEALAELSKDTGRDVSKAARDLYKDLRTFVSSARRDSGKLAKAPQRDFEQAQKRLAGRQASARTPTTPARPRAASSARASSTAPAARTSGRREQLLALVIDQPGITVAQAARQFGVKDATGLYRVARRLQEEGLVRKRGAELHPTAKAQRK